MISSPLQGPNYDKYAVTRLNVNEVQIVNTYIPPYHAPNIEHQLYLPPYAALRNWAQNRFKAVGNIGLAKVQILDASIVKHDLPVNDGFQGYFTDQVNAEYKMHLHVLLNVISPNFENQPFADVEVSRMIQTTQTTSLAERDAELNQMVLQGLDQVDQLMTKSINEKIGNVVQ